jgi:hypothetical protein
VVNRGELHGGFAVSKNTPLFPTLFLSGAAEVGEEIE